jgi:competence ComEA-like helix-hairpin-helix protein
MPPDAPRSFEIWTRPQRGVLIAFVLILSSVLLARLYFNRAYVSNPQPQRSSRHDELADRLDPNVATWQELAVLPQIGEKRAKEIVAYRESRKAPVFATAEDLLRVKGIGAATVATLRPHLTFPDAKNTARRAYNPSSQQTEHAHE